MFDLTDILPISQILGMWRNVISKISFLRSFSVVSLVYVKMDHMIQRQDIWQTPWNGVFLEKIPFMLGHPKFVTTFWHDGSKPEICNQKRCLLLGSGSVKTRFHCSWVIWPQQQLARNNRGTVVGGILCQICAEAISGESLRYLMTCVAKTMSDGWRLESKLCSHL
jgi:hypothetical protein